MSNVRDLLFQQDTLDIIFQKYGYTNDYSILPWGNGFGVVNETGNMLNYINIDSNGNMLLQNEHFSTVGSISSVSKNQFQFYDHNQMTGTLFTFPDPTYSGLDIFINSNSGGVPELLSDVVDIDVDMASSLLNMGNLFDLI